MTENVTVVSNNIGPNREPADRIYGSPYGNLRLIQADYSTYKGNITKKSIIKESHTGEKFRTYVYVTDDGRWFDRAGIPILAPTEVEEDEDDRRETSENTEEGIQASSETQDEESLQGSNEDDPTVAGTEEK